MASKDFMNSAANEVAAQTDTGVVDLGMVGYVTAPTITQAPNAGRGGQGGPTAEQFATKFANNGTNKVVSGTAQVDSIKLNTAFTPNILDNYDVITYHWKLFITGPEAAASGKIFDTSVQTIIAESGVSDLTIDNVEIRSVTTPTVETGTGVATGVKFTIVEPSGAGLLDKMFYQAASLGIGNWVVMPVFLQLQFRGRDADSSSSLIAGQAGEISSLSWTWPLKITSTKANVTEVGTTYDFDAVIYNDVAQSNANFTIQQDIKLKNVMTVADAVKELEEKINTDQIVKLIDSYSIPDTYTFVIDPIISGEPITKPNNNKNSSRSGSMDKIDVKSGTFSTGTSIDKIIDNILAQTERYQKLMPNSKTPGSDGQPAQEEETQMKKFWRIITETKPYKFDPRRNDDAKDITIYVVDYDLGIMEANVLQQTNSTNDKEVEQKRLMTYIQKSILKKKYNYIFTGLNDQVKSFDITLNNAFAIAASRYGGIYSNNAMASQGVAAQDNAKKEAEVSEKLAKAIRFRNNTATSNSREAQSAYKDAVSAINSAKLSTDTKTRYMTLLDQSKPADKLTANKLGLRQGIDNNGTLEKSAFMSASLAESVNGLHFISDVNVSSQRTKNRYNEYLQSTKGKLRPIAVVEQMQDKHIAQGFESDSNSGLQKLSSLFSVAMNGSTDAAFAHIKLKIKGDPFWLFPKPSTITGTSDVNQSIYISDLGDAAAIEWIKTLHKKADTANLVGTDNFILLRFRTPRIYDVEANPSVGDPYSEVAMFSGIYKVTTIVNTFSNGNFFQELECIIDPEINLLNFTKQLDEVSKTPDKPASAQSLTDIPVTATKTQR
jgi:hypothetical protein